MTQKKKDFTAAAASVFVDKMITPTAPQETWEVLFEGRDDLGREKVKHTIHVEAAHEAEAMQKAEAILRAEPPQGKGWKTKTARVVNGTKEPKPQKATAPAEPAAAPKVAAKRGRKPNPNRDSEERVTLIVDSAAVEKLRAIAWQNRRKFKDVILDAMQTYIEKYEAENGKVKTR